MINESKNGKALRIERSREVLGTALEGIIELKDLGGNDREGFLTMLKRKSAPGQTSMVRRGSTGLLTRYNLSLFRGTARKFTVKYRQQSGRQIRINKITFRRFTNSVIFPSLHRDFYAVLGHFGNLQKVIFSRKVGNFKILIWYFASGSGLKASISG